MTARRAVKQYGDLFLQLRSLLFSKLQPNVIDSLDVMNPVNLASYDVPNVLLVWIEIGTSRRTSPDKLKIPSLL